MKELSKNYSDANNLLTIQQASEWATKHLGKKVTASNISYLIQYGCVSKLSNDGKVVIAKEDLKCYYSNSYNGRREKEWRSHLGGDLNWHLSFDYLREADTTKHVHRIHPYKGKFIPQLVEYFIDDHKDEFKQDVYFNRRDIILDPFCGSGTTLVESNEKGIHALGIDVSELNALISNVKVSEHDLVDINKEVIRITDALRKFLANKSNINFDRILLEHLSIFNNKHFPVPEYKVKVRRGEIEQASYGRKKEQEFLLQYWKLVEKFGIDIEQKNNDTFLDKWYFSLVRDEIDVVFNEVKKIENIDTRNVISVILSRTIRSCRATTHADLATLKKPIKTTYYCAKHGKICKPLFSIAKWWNFYTQDTLKRIGDFNKLRTQTYQYCLSGDSRCLDIFNKIRDKHTDFSKVVQKQKVRGIFSSPPYLGLIDYHEQHAYAYDLFKFKRKDDLEIGPLYRGRGRYARESYVQGISDVLNHCKEIFCKNYDVFLVANDKNNLYPDIATKSGMRIVNQYKRPVLNRTEKDKGAFSETIFHLKEK